MTADELHTAHLEHVKQLGGRIVRAFIAEKTNKSEMTSHVQYVIGDRYFHGTLQDFDSVTSYAKGTPVNP